MAAQISKKHSPTSWSLILPIIAAIALSGCAVRQKMDYPVAYDSPAAALRVIGSDMASGAITATAKIEITAEGARYPLKAAVMIQRPDSLRIESIPLIGPPDFFLSLTAGEIRIHIPAKSCFCTGAATPRNISRFLHVHLNATELVSLMLGLPPDNGAKDRELSGRQEENRYRVDQQTEDKGLLSIWIDPLINRVVQAAFTKNGAKMYEAVFEKHVLVGEYCLPELITVTGQKGAALKIRYSELQQIPATQAAFPLPVPAGIAPTFLE